jgi:hypothetical protein
MKTIEVVPGLFMTEAEIERQTKVLIQALHTAHQDGEQLKAFIIRDALRMLGAIK